jgi:peroxiredoxin
MKKIFIIMLLLPVLCQAQDKAESFKISGKTNQLNQKVDWVYFIHRVNGSWQTDSVQPKNNKFKFTGTINEPMQASVRVQYVKKDADAKAKRESIPVFLEAGKIKIIAIDSFSNAKVKGSRAHDEFTRLNEKAKPYTDKLNELYASYSAFRKSKDEENMNKVEEKIDAVDKEMNETVYGEYIKANPQSPLALYALKTYAGWDIDADKVEPLFNSLPRATRQLPSAVEFKDLIDISKKTGLGRIAMEFTQNDTAGKPVSLSSLRGKYLLIDFWASWCGPCRQENPNVVKAFQKYKDQGFSILGVSLDRAGQKEKWLKAISDDNLTWTQVSDLKFWDNEVAKLYGVRAIPQNFLLDPEGKIIGKNLRGEDLVKKLEEVIEKKAF